MIQSDGGDRPAPTVAVIGGGPSGVLAMTHLIARAKQPIDIVVVEPTGQLAAGVGYGTTEEVHLLNAPSSSMSAWSDLPNDFTTFAKALGYSGDGHAFVSRRHFREYLLTSLERARAHQDAACTAELLVEEVVALNRQVTDPGHGRLVVGMRRGSHIEADHVVLAIGPPSSIAPWSGFAEPPKTGKLVEDPWIKGALSQLDSHDRVLLVGSGLTMVDVALALKAHGHHGRLFARSRHGLLPLSQLDESVVAIEPNLDASLRSAREIFTAVRVAADKANASGDNWRGVVAGFRDRIPLIWQDLAEDEQRRLLRHAQRYWEIHRHRMAPEVNAAIRDLLATGELDLGIGRLVGLEELQNGYLAHFEGVGEETEVLEVDAVVNCTGPAQSYETSSSLIRHLLSNGTAVVDPSGLGLLVDENGDLCDSSAIPDPQIHTLGWPRRGRFYEAHSIREIRVQAEELAGRIVSTMG